MTEQDARGALDLDRLEQIAREATPGPWILDYLDSGEHGIFAEDDNPDFGSLGAGSAQVAGWLTARNADYIYALQPDTALSLIALARRAEEPGDWRDSAETVTVSLTEAQQRAERLEAAIREALGEFKHSDLNPAVRTLRASSILTNALKGEGDVASEL